MKKPLLTGILLFAIVFHAFSQTNNLCGTPTAVTPGATCGTAGNNVAGTIVAGTTYTAMTGTCPSSAVKDVWFSFTATTTRVYISLTITGGSNATLFQVLTGASCGGTVTSVFCSSGLTGEVTGLSVGQPYLIRVYNAANSNFNVCVVTPPANETCATAQDLGAPVATCGAVSGNLAIANSTGSPAGDYGTTNDVWYRFTTPASIYNTFVVTIGGLGSALTNTTIFVEAYKATTCGDVTQLNSLGSSNGAPTLTLTMADLAFNTTYYLRVYTPNATNTSAPANYNFTICVNRNNIGAPANNECAAATNIPVGTSLTGQRVSNATASTGIPAPCSGTPDDDVWYRFTANSSTHVVTVNPNGTLNNSVAMVQAFSGACGSLVSIGCGRESLTLTGLSSGTQYYVRVYSAGAFGTNPWAAPNGATFAIGVSGTASVNIKAGRMNEIYKQTILSGSQLLNDPWEVAYGPDNKLWVTEAKGYKVFTFDPNTGERSTVLDLTRGSNFSPVPADKDRNIQFDINVRGGQGGLAGLAVHPDFATKPWVYLSYIYEYDSTRANSEGIFFRNAIVRYTYNSISNRLENPEVLCDTVPGSSDHNSQRMIIAPVSGTYYLFYAAGDMGAGQFENRLRPMKAQYPSAYEGKILRFHTEPDGDAGNFDKWIPNNNPYNSTMPVVQNAVWSIGIRNNQGFAYNPATGQLFGSSHGPYSDDEINIILPSKNYGHPLVIGYGNDNNYNLSSAGANNGSTCPVITDETANMLALGVDYQDPIFAAYPRTQAEIKTIYDNNPPNGGWPSEGWSGMSFYESNVIPGWKNSLVVASLKWGRVLRFKLNAAGTIQNVTTTDSKDTIAHFDSQNRFRDVAFSPSGKDLFVIMDKSAATSGPSTDNPSVVSCAGCLQKYTFLGYLPDLTTEMKESTITANVPVSDNNGLNAGSAVTIDNDNKDLWVPINGPDGNIVAEIKANGQLLGNITACYYKHTGPLRQYGGKKYLDRNISITPQFQPTDTVSVRLYISKAEFDALDADVTSGINSIGDLRVLKNNDPCGSSVIASSTTLLAPKLAKLHGADAYVVHVTVSNFSTFYFGAQLITLPVNLLTFTGTLVDNKTTALHWRTTQEVNASHFTIERSVDGTTFKDIGRVTATGGNMITEYDFNDNEVPVLGANVIYYRLKIVDLDGRFTYSNIIVLRPTYTTRISVAPNPATHDIKVLIEAGNAFNAQWQIVDNTGRVVMRGANELKAGRNTITIDINKLASGVYHLSVQGAEQFNGVKIRKL